HVLLCHTMFTIVMFSPFFFHPSAHHLHLHSFPTRRSSDLCSGRPRCSTTTRRITRCRAPRRRTVLSRPSSPSSQRLPPWPESTSSTTSCTTGCRHRNRTVR